MAQREAVKAEHPDAEFGEIARIIGAKWRALGDEARTEFVTMAEHDKERFIREAGPEAITRPRPASGRRSSRGPPAQEDTDEKILVRAKRKLTAEQMQQYADDAEIIDITAKSPSTAWRKFCFAFPHGSIPVPGHKHKWGMSVQGIFEALKVFQKSGVDKPVMSIDSMNGLRRAENDRNGKLLGWSQGLKGNAQGKPLLDAKEARWSILFPSYKYVLDNCVQAEVAQLRAIMASGKRLVLLDTEASTDLRDCERPVCAAELLRRYLNNEWPTQDTQGEGEPAQDGAEE